MNESILVYSPFIIIERFLLNKLREVGVSSQSSRPAPLPSRIWNGIWNYQQLGIDVAFRVVNILDKESTEYCNTSTRRK